MINYILIVLTLGFIIWLQITLASSKKKSGARIEDFINAENEANFSRKKDLPAEFYFIPDISGLPVKDYTSDITGKVSAKRDKVIKLAKTTMIRLPKPMNNREIKLEYGVSNLETVTNGEEMYQAFIRALVDWADALINSDNTEDAKTVLLKAVECGCDISRCFLALADIYIKENDLNAFSNLIERLESGEVMPQNKEIRDKTIAKIKRMYDNR